MYCNKSNISVVSSNVLLYCEKWILKHVTDFFGQIWITNLLDSALWLHYSQSEKQDNN
jgi:hypothetical protein